MSLKLKDYKYLMKETYSEWNEDKVMRLGAALAYYTVFSLPPLLVIVIAVAGLLFGSEAARGQIVNQFQGLLGRDGAQEIQAMIQGASQRKTGIIATAIGIIILLIGASSVFAQLQDALNTIWGVKPKPKLGIKYLIKIRALSLLIVFGIGFLLLVSLTLSALLSSFSNMLNAMFQGLGIISTIMQGADILVSFGIITLFFAVMYKVLPDAEMKWKDVWLGAAFTALLFTVGKFLIGFYIGKSNIGSYFGAAGSLVIILTWIFYSTQIVFFGAEFTKVYANKLGSKIVPSEHAVPVSDESRREQGMVGKPGRYAGWDGRERRFGERRAAH